MANDNLYQQYTSMTFNYANISSIILYMAESCHELACLRLVDRKWDEIVNEFSVDAWIYCLKEKRYNSLKTNDTYFRMLELFELGPGHCGDPAVYEHSFGEYKTKKELDVAKSDDKYKQDKVVWEIITYEGNIIGAANSLYIIPFINAVYRKLPLDYEFIIGRVGYKLCSRKFQPILYHLINSNIINQFDALLMQACYRRDSKLIKLCLEKGADPNRRYKRCAPFADDHDFIHVHWAYHCSLDVAFARGNRNVFEVVKHLVNDKNYDNLLLCAKINRRMGYFKNMEKHI